jgi:hypothetical protein
MLKAMHFHYKDKAKYDDVGIVNFTESYRIGLLAICITPTGEIKAIPVEEIRLKVGEEYKP